MTQPNSQVAIPKDLAAGATAARDLPMNCERRVIDNEARTVELAFSSETPVPRWWGIEILDHAPKAMRLARMKRGAALLMDHATNDQVGVIESVQIGTDKVGRAVVRFGKSARASEIFQDVIDGIRTNVSVGYQIHAAVLESEKDGVPTYRITDWEPHEISFVSVPADIRVGVGRDHETIAPSPQGITAMENQPNPEHAAALQRAIADSLKNGAEAERKRVSEIVAIGTAYAGRGLDALIAGAVQSGMSIDEVRAEAIKILASAPTRTAEIGLTKGEVKRYSIVRALAYLANPGDRSAREAAKFELECSLAAADRAGKPAQGLMVPYEVLKRDLTVGTAADGGNLVGTEIRPGDFIEMLRNAMVIDRLGARFLTGLVGNIAIPRQSGGATHYWLAEGAAPTESKQAIAQLTMSPKTIGAFTDISRKLLLQSSIDVENFVQMDLAKVLGLGIQSAAIDGGGTNEPTGILSTVGIGDVAGGTNGLAPTWAHVVELETDVAVANADVGTLAYLTNAKVRGKLKSTEKFATSNGAPIWGEGTTPLNGYRAGVTNAVPSNLTKGSSSVASALIFGNFDDLVIGMWGGLDLTVDPYSNSTSGTVRVVALQDCDVGVRHVESFSAMQDALTA